MYVKISAIPDAKPASAFCFPVETASPAEFPARPLESEVIGLFDALRDPVLRYAVSFGLSVHDGEEVTQEVFMALVSLSEVCSVDGGDVITPVSKEEEAEVFSEYGISNGPVGDYEVDYLITPDLGGADDVRNLWPEPHRTSRWNSYAKDQLEDRLHRLVCGGKLTLADAQREISQNWIVAYRKYLGADSPNLSDMSKN